MVRGLRDTTGHAPAMPAADPRATPAVPPRAANGGGQPEERRRRVRGAADAIDLSDFGLDPDRPRPAPPAPPVISADERATLDAIDAVARRFAQGLPRARVAPPAWAATRPPSSMVTSRSSLTPRSLASIIASSTSVPAHATAPKSRSHRQSLETRFGPFEVWRADNRENPSFDVMLTGADAALSVHLEVMYPEPVGADWRDAPIDEVHLLRRPAPRE
jgi:hypothetical protein